MSNHRAVAQFFRLQVGIPPKSLERTAGHLRKAGEAPASKCGKGRVDHTSASGVKMLLGHLLAPDNTKVVETVQGVYARHLTAVTFNPLSSNTSPEGPVRAAFDQIHALGIRFINRHSVGSMLERIIDTMRDGTFSQWSTDDRDVIVDFYDRVMGTIIYFDRTQSGTSAVFSFDIDKTAPPLPLQRIIRVNGQLLRGLATALGPLPSAIPPPPY